MWSKRYLNKHAIHYIVYKNSTNRKQQSTPYQPTQHSWSLTQSVCTTMLKVCEPIQIHINIITSSIQDQWKKHNHCRSVSTVFTSCHIHSPKHPNHIDNKYLNLCAYISLHIILTPTNYNYQHLNNQYTFTKTSKSHW